MERSKWKQAFRFYIYFLYDNYRLVFYLKYDLGILLHSRQGLIYFLLLIIGIFFFFLTQKSDANKPINKRVRI